jgi:hypothetical protein
MPQWEKPVMSDARFDHICTTIFCSAAMVAVAIMGYAVIDMLMTMAECLP